MKNSKILKIVCCGGALIVLAACQTAQPALTGQLDYDLGSAVKHNIEAQFVRPTDAQKANTYIPADPARAAMAHKKYQENTIEELENVNASGGG